MRVKLLAEKIAEIMCKAVDDEDIINQVAPSEIRKMSEYLERMQDVSILFERSYDQLERDSVMPVSLIKLLLNRIYKETRDRLNDVAGDDLKKLEFSVKGVKFYTDGMTNSYSRDEGLRVIINIYKLKVPDFKLDFLGAGEANE